MTGRDEQSLLAGRSSAELSSDDMARVTQTLVGLDDTVPFAPDNAGKTRFVVESDPDGMEVGIVYLGRDIYPGTGVVDSNSALSMQTAVAHEICHYHRWLNHTELPLGQYRHLDEAMTSLDAALRFPRLTPHEVQSLVRDALQRLSSHYAELTEGAQPNA